jgi:hypothetical protein
MLFSATMPDDIVKLTHDMLRQPQRIEIAPQGKTADRVAQHLYFVPMAQKRQLLSELLKDVSLNRVIVFTRTKHGANRVAEHLSETGVVAEAIHGNKSQNARQRALELFRSGKASVLVDDLRYGRPRTTQLDAFVGHEETNGQPTHLMAINLNRQVMVIELPGGEAAKARTLSGPYLFGANEELTPLQLHLQDLDGDGKPDLLLDIRQEQLVYLNRDGAFRLPTPEEQAALQRGSGQ